MANFYWVGGSTATIGSYSDGLQTTSGYTGIYNFTWVRAFDFNNALNWRVGTGPGYPESMFMTTTRAPGGGETLSSLWYPDTVIFCYDGYQGTGPYALPNAKAPCLFGGCTLATTSNAGVTWIAGGSGGTNVFGATAARYINIDIRQNGLARPSGSSNYDFSFIGGGFAGATYVGYPTSDFNPLLDANSKGFTLNSAIWGGASWASLTNAFLGSTFAANEKYNKLRLKIASMNAGRTPSGSGSSTVENSPGNTSPSALNQGIVNIHQVPAYVQYGSGATALTVVNSYSSIYGPAHYIFNGGRWQTIGRNGVSLTAFQPSGSGYNGALAKTGAAAVYLNNAYGRPRPHLSLYGCTAAEVKFTDYAALNIGAWYTDPNCQIGKLGLVVVEPKSWLLEIDGSGFQREYALSDMGISGATAAPSANIEVTEQGFQEILNPGQSDNRHGVYFGRTDSSTPTAKGVTAAWVKIGGASWLQGRVTINTNTSVNQFDLVIGNMSAGSNMVNSKYAKINTLTMKRSTNAYGQVSTIDLSRANSFNNWEFGYQAGNQIFGGIVSLDEGNIIRGSAGVNLFNEQLISQFRSSGTRGGKTDPSGTPILPVPPNEYV